MKTKIKNIISLAVLVGFCGLFTTACSFLLGEKDKEELSVDVLKYLDKHYNGEFEMINSHWVCNEGNLNSGCPCYGLTCTEEKTLSHPFYINVCYTDDTMRVTNDGYKDMLVDYYADKSINNFLSEEHNQSLVELSLYSPKSVEEVLNEEDFIPYMKKNGSSYDYTTVYMAVIADSVMRNQTKYDTLVWQLLIQLDYIYLKEGRMTIYFYDQTFEGGLEELRGRFNVLPRTQEEKISYVWSLDYNMDSFRADTLTGPAWVSRMTTKKESYY